MSELTALVSRQEAIPTKSNVYFTRTITPEKVVELYRALGVTLPGKVAVKVHSGEKGNQNFLHRQPLEADGRTWLDQRFYG